jgi:hypothetical protein
MQGLIATGYWLMAGLSQFHAHQFGDHHPLFPGIAPDRNGVKVLKGVHVTLIQGGDFVHVDFTDVIAVIAANDIRIVSAHGQPCLKRRVAGLWSFATPLALGEFS